MKGIRKTLQKERSGKPQGIEKKRLTAKTFFQVLLTSKTWRLQSDYNHSTAYVDQRKGQESSKFLTESPHAALRTGNAHQDLKESENNC